MKIKILTEKCTGCGSCPALCPEVFELQDVNGEMKAVIINQDAKCANTSVEDVVAICPEEAIVIEE